MTEKLSSRREMELQMDGRLPLERQHPKKGESQWYYVDPRGRSENFTLLSEAKTIDVPTKDTPNPYLQDIMREDADKNPENYYIWRTVSDDRVRSSHEERDGEIFAWDEPPEGGHPGEDYNCRCTAEPYVPGKYKRNEYAKTKNVLTDDIRKRLFEAMKDDLILFEGKFNHPYIDTEGKISIGVGYNIDLFEDFKNVSWNGMPSVQQLKHEYDHLHTLQAGKSAESYENESALRIQDEVVFNQLEKNFNHSFDQARKKFDNFDELPLNAQKVILDMQFNMRNKFNAVKWKNFMGHIEKKEWAKAAGESSRYQVLPKRNEWAKQLLLSIEE